MHNGFLNLGSQKMSKSLGNVELVHDLVGRWPAEALRWALLASHYRQPLAWTDSVVEQARSSLDTLYGALRRASDVEADQAEPSEGYLEALFDDLNTPKANSHLFTLSQKLETTTGRDRRRLKGELLACGALTGFLQADPEVWFQGAGDPTFKAMVEDLVERRERARAAKNWIAADRIRNELAALNVEVMDGPGGGAWSLRQRT
jgi:cysteinyl-tRNA synthetase